jgi:hypothetical protein
LLLLVGWMAGAGWCWVDWHLAQQKLSTAVEQHTLHGRQQTSEMQPIVPCDANLHWHNK